MVQFLKKNSVHMLNSVTFYTNKLDKISVWKPKFTESQPHYDSCNFTMRLTDVVEWKGSNEPVTHSQTKKHGVSHTRQVCKIS